MTLDALISQYGYLAVLVGSLLEGETALVLAGFAAHRGFLNLWIVLAVALVVTILLDQTVFSVGRRYGEQWLARRQSWAPAVSKVQARLERHANLVILGFRFWYGLRLITPFTLGTTRVPRLRFTLLEIMAATLWVAVYGGGGYLFGQTMQAVFGRTRRYQELFFLAIAAVGLAIWLAHVVRRRRRRRAGGGDPVG